MKTYDPKTTARLRKAIREADGSLPPTLTDMKFVRYVREGRGWDADHTWAVYISHDPCHDDGKGFVDDRNTVIAFHRQNGTFKIIGRELDMKLARKVALGKV
jgi:hypothetical protein